MAKSPKPSLTIETLTHDEATRKNIPTADRDVKDGNTEHITREPEQVKALRDTWRDGIHSMLQRDLRWIKSRSFHV
ncbi:MAG: hypothetical protein ACYCY0_04120 [Acidithiobacillus ferrivorans]|jgi:FtsZ-binding cell division protein ZapB